MKVLIEKYKNFDIIFDTSNELFSSELNNGVKKKNKSSKSYASIKKSINNFTTENNGNTHTQYWLCNPSANLKYLYSQQCIGYKKMSKKNRILIKIN